MHQFTLGISDYDSVLELNQDETSGYNLLSEIFNNFDNTSLASIIDDLPISQQGSLIKHCLNERLGNYFHRKNNSVEVEYFLGLRRHKLIEESKNPSSENSEDEDVVIPPFDPLYFDKKITQHVPIDKLWMLLIDGQDHKSGRLAYDTISEPGYINGCETAAAFMFRTQEAKISAQYIMNIRPVAKRR